MSRTRNGARKTQPVTPAEALQILESAINYCRQAGLDVRAGNIPGGLALTIGGAELQRTESGARFVVAPQRAELAPIG
jgi:hypothetical protein